MNAGDLFVLANSGAATYFYMVGGVLVALALIVTLVGLQSDDFPSTPVMRAMIGLFVVAVLATGVGAVLAARDEQAIRREENEEAAKEADEVTEEKEQAEAPQGAGEAAPPEGEPDASVPPESGGGDAAKGAALFVDAGCGSCHTLADAGTDGAIGPDLDDVIPGQDAEAVRTSIVDPGAETSEGFPAGSMPADYGDQFTEVEIDLLVAYLVGAAGS